MTQPETSAIGVAARMLQTVGVSIDLGGKRVLHDISINIPAGGRVSIIGPNGAGKTTLLRALAGLITPSSGEILANGHAMSSLSSRELARLIAYVPQMTEKTLPCRVADFVLLSRYAHGRHLFGSADSDDREAALHAMQRVGVAGFADRDLSTLSGGERQKVLVAAALAQEAPILLLDEPAAFLDYRRQLELTALLDDVRRNGTGSTNTCTIVSVVHDLNGGALDGDLVIALLDGRVAFTGSPAELTRETRLAEIYGVEFELVHHSGTGRTLVIPIRPDITASCHGNA